jgi:hypothetical protein
MASDAEAILSHPRSNADQLAAAQTWLRDYGAGLAVGLAAFLFAGGVLSGLRLFDNDYDWINQAQDAGLLQLLGDILRPIPERWGFQDRPTQTLVFRLIYGAVGYSAFSFYTFKAALFGGVCFGITRLSITLGLGHRASVLAGTIFALSSSGQASALWVSDFELLTEILILAAFGIFWRILHSVPKSKIEECLNQAMFVLISVAAHRTKGSAKLIPAIVFLYLILYRRDQIRRFLPSLALIALTIIPVFSVFDDPIPPFAPFAEDHSQGWMWKPANLQTLGTLVVGNFHPFFGTSGPNIIAFSMLSVLAPAVLWSTGLAFIYLMLRSRKSFSLTGWRFLCIWAAISIASYTAFPRLPEGFMARYIVVGLVPVSMLIGLILDQASRRFTAKVAWPALGCILMMHAATNLSSTRYLRDTLGQVIVAYDQAREHISTQVTDSDVLVIGFDYGYHRRVSDSNRYHKESLRIDKPGSGSFHVLIRTDQNLDAIEHESTIQQIQRSVRFPAADGRMKVGIRPVRTFSGLTSSFYDRHVYGMRQSFAGILYKVTYGQEQS